MATEKIIKKIRIAGQDYNVGYSSNDFTNELKQQIGTNKSNISKNATDISNLTDKVNSIQLLVIHNNPFTDREPAPGNNDKNKIHVFPKAGTTKGDFEEYIWVVNKENLNGKWEKVGSLRTDIELKDYEKTSDVDRKISSLKDGSDSTLKSIDGKIAGLTGQINTINGAESLSGSFRAADKVLMTNLQAYADQAETDAVNTAKADATSKANTAEQNAKTHAETKAAAAEKNANEYTDTKLTELKNSASQHVALPFIEIEDNISEDKIKPGSIQSDNIGVVYVTDKKRFYYINVSMGQAQEYYDNAPFDNEYNIATSHGKKAHPGKLYKFKTQDIYNIDMNGELVLFKKNPVYHEDSNTLELF